MLSMISQKLNRILRNEILGLMIILPSGVGRTVASVPRYIYTEHTMPGTKINLPSWVSDSTSKVATVKSVRSPFGTSSKLNGFLFEIENVTHFRGNLKYECKNYSSQSL